MNDAGRLFVLRRELLGLKAERDMLEQRIRQLERKIADAEAAFDSTFERLMSNGRSRSGLEDTPVMTGKLPHRVLSLMKRDPSRLYTAAELSAELSVRDIQQVRTALARLVRKGLVRRSRSKGEFTI